jgi:hypothetical protein
MPRCLDEAQRLAAADPTRPLPAAWGAHLAACPRCRREVDAVRSVGALLAELGGAERRAHADPVPTWAAVAGALEHPSRVERLPLGWAGLVRMTSDLARPAFAGSLVVMVVGLGLGTWLGLAADRTTASASASDVFDASNLDGAADGGFESGLFAADETAGAIGDDADDGAGTADDTLGGGAQP